MSAATSTGDASDESAARATRDAEKDRRSARRLRWLVPIGTLAIRALAATWRVRVVGAEPRDALRAAKRPFVYAFWHGELLTLVWLHRGEGTAVLVSSHRDGEIIARVAHRLGLATVRGSSSRGGARALLGMVDTLNAGTPVAVTPDGPRGPARQFAPGALVAAQRAGVPIIPIAVRTDRAWRLRSWDRFLIPKPFARVVVAYGAPTLVEARSAREAPDEVPRFEALLADNAAAAELVLGGPGA